MLASTDECTTVHNPKKKSLFCQAKNLLQTCNKKKETHLHALLEGVSQVGANVLQYGVATLVFASVSMLDNVLTGTFSYAHHTVAFAFHDLAHVCCQSSQLEPDLWDEADVHHTCINNSNG